MKYLSYLTKFIVNFRKSELCAEAEDCMERLASENEQLKAENISKDKILLEYSNKLEETSKLLKITSTTNKKLQKRLNVKRYCKEVCFVFIGRDFLIECMNVISIGLCLFEF